VDEAGIVDVVAAAVIACLGKVVRCRANEPQVAPLTGFSADIRDLATGVLLAGAVASSILCRRQALHESGKGGGCAYGSGAVCA
jgi:hypothetical protein